MEKEQYYEHIKNNLCTKGGKQYMGCNKLREYEVYSKVNMDEYIGKIECKIKHILESNNTANRINDILLNDYITKHVKEVNNSLVIKQLQMKIGNIWQITIGNYGDFIDLGNGHHTGLDVKNRKRKIIMEIKNRYNTDNASSRKSNFDKLAIYKNKHPDFVCMYAVINDKTTNGQYKIFEHGNKELIYISGMHLLEYIFGFNTQYVLTTLHNIINSYLV